MKPQEIVNIIKMTVGTHPEGVNNPHAGKPKIKEFCRKFGLSEATLYGHIYGTFRPSLQSEALYRALRRIEILKATIRRINND